MGRRVLWEWASDDNRRVVVVWGVYLVLGAALGLAWAHDSVGAAVGGGVFGAGFGVYRGYSRRPNPAVEADSAELQRSAVVRRAVHRGEAPADPALAEEAIVLAQLLQDPPGKWVAWLLLCGLDGLFLAGAVALARSGSPVEAAVAGMVALIFLPWCAWLRYRTVKRGRQAKAAAVRQLKVAASQEGR